MDVFLNWFSWMNETHLRERLTLILIHPVLTQLLANMHEPGTPDIF